MTRRIAIAILLTTWSALIVIGVGIYFATRHTLLTDLDQSIVARAVALSRGYGVSAAGIAAAVPQEDRFLIRNGIGQTLARPTTRTSSPVQPVILNGAFTRLADGRRVRTLTLALASSAGSADTTITYSTSAERFDHLLNELVIWLVAIGAAAGVCAAGAAMVLSRLALRPLLSTARAICEIDERTLNRRIEDRALPVELSPMAQRLNEMLARLEAAFEQRARFLADASHELRTPVAALMTTLEVSLRRPRSADEMNVVLKTCLSDVQSLRHLVDRLMQQVRSESSGESPATFDLTVLLNECADLLLRARPDKPLDVRRHLPPSLWVRSMPERFRGIVINLLSNAFEYTPAGGTIELTCEVSDELVLTVSDSGSGVPDELVPRLFMPFSRADERRDSSGGHAGLGLSIVQAHAQALGGRCVLEPRRPGVAGATFGVYLPTSLVVMAPDLVEAK
jgi:signal transduction histidine kinase